MSISFSKILVSRIRLILESPAPLILAIPGSESIEFEISSWLIGLAPTTKSKSPIDSFRLLAEPANSIFSTCFILLINCFNALP